ncbi:MAG: transposase [Verrucomicrobia bacterium]|nr:MAG: transposase [Verrucomicrobiota bacterium]
MFKQTGFEDTPQRRTPFSLSVLSKQAHSVVERTFGWLMLCRRMVSDYERTVRRATGWSHVAMIRITLRRLA